MQTMALVVAECCFEVRLPFWEVTYLALSYSYWQQGLIFLLETITYITIDTALLLAYSSDH